MKIKLQSLNCQTKIKVLKNRVEKYDQIKFIRLSGSFQIKKHHFSKKAQRIASITHETMLLRNFYRQSPRLEI